MCEALQNGIEKACVSKVGKPSSLLNKRSSTKIQNQKDKTYVAQTINTKGVSGI